MRLASSLKSIEGCRLGLAWIVGALVFWAAPEAYSASFDCNTSETHIEQLICADEGLSELDSKLAEAYSNALKAADRLDGERLKTDQVHWLRVTRNQCSNTACLLNAYRMRTSALDPIADHNVTCDKMRQYPKLIFLNAIDLGSGSGSPNEVDYSCPESLSQQAFMRGILDVTEQIRGGWEPQQCTGTIIYAQARYYQFELTKAGFFPKALLGGTVASGSFNWQSFSHPAKSDGSDVFLYMQQWSDVSVFNRTLYNQFVIEFNRAYPTLVQHYQHLGLSSADALTAAASAMRLIVNRAAGAFPRATFEVESPLVRLVQSNHVTENDVQTELTRNKSSGLSQYSSVNIAKALRVALLNNHSNQVIETLVRAMSPDAIRGLSDGEEPILSFALDNQRLLNYLLDANFPVDAENPFGKTALFYAIETENVSAVKRLLKAGADVNHAYKAAKQIRPNEFDCTYASLTHTKRTPLMHAAQHGDVEMIKLLLRAGADLHAVDEIGYNALDYTVLGKTKSNEQYLKSLGLIFEAAH